MTKARLVLLNMFKPSSDVFVDRSKAVLLLGIVFDLCFMYIFIMLSCLFLAALWSPAGKGLTSWFSCQPFTSRCHMGKWQVNTIPKELLSYLPLSHMVLRVRYVTCLYRFLIFAFFSTLLDALHANQQLFSHVGMLTWVEPVQSHSFTKNNLFP